MTDWADKVIQDTWLWTDSRKISLACSKALRDAVAEKDKEIERLRAEGAKLVDENNRLQEQWDTVYAAAEDKHEYVLAQINQTLKAEIARLKAENAELRQELDYFDPPEGTRSHD